MIDLTEIIAHDPILSMQVLKVANSSTYGLTAQISSIQHAGVIIGLAALKNLAISMLVGEMFESGDPKTAEARQQLLDHTILMACISKHISRAMPSGNPDEAFLGGMLHDIGKLILADYRPDEFSEVIEQTVDGESEVMEVQVFGISHVTIGEACCESWGLPGSMIDIVADHHQVSPADASCDLQAVIAGNELSRSWDELTQEHLDSVLNCCPDFPSGALTLEDLKSKVQEEIDVMTEVRASR